MTEPKAPFYGLYGERAVPDRPGFIHIEDIAARSKGLDWVIKPHRHNHLFQVLCVMNSEVELNLNGDTQVLQGSWIVILPVGAIHGYRFKPDSEGFVLSIADHLVNQQALSGDRQVPHRLQQSARILPLLSDQDNSRHFLHYIELLQQEFSLLQADQDQALNLITGLALLALERQIRQEEMLSNPGDNSSALFARFQALLENHFCEQWPVTRYAEALHVSTSTLNRLCQRQTGGNTKQLIHERVMTEARRRLMYTRQPIEEISYRLGFRDYPYFARFFKNQSGMTAGEYRRQADHSILE